MATTSLTVGKRLGMGFGAVIALFLVAATMSIADMARINDRIESVVTEKWPKVQASMMLLRHLDAISIALRTMMLASGGDDFSASRTQIDESKKAIAAAMSKLGRLVKSKEGVALLQNIGAAQDKYFVAVDELARLVDLGQAQEGRVYLGAQARPLLKAYQDAVDAMIKHQVESMEEGERAAAETYASGRTVQMALTVLALMVAALVALWITRSLVRKLGGEPDAAAAVARAIGHGDLTVVVTTRPGDDDSMMASMRATVAQLTDTIVKVKHVVDAIATASRQIAAGNQDLSQRTEEQASSLEETASSMEELTGTVRQNADNAREASALAACASDVAVRGGSAVADVVETMGAISDSSRRIADIIGVIDGIAFQTNILALNAAVEAARAGEQGRGFAVVAAEVRSLAQRSAAAAREIKALIDDSVTKVESGAKRVDAAGRTMEEVVASIKRVTDIMADITAASQEQTAGIEQVNAAVVQMDQVTQQNAALVEEVAAAAASMQDQAQSLVDAVSVFRLDAAASATQDSAQAVAPGAPAAAWPQVERRGPDRAKNVTRLPPRASEAKPRARTGTDEGWSEF